MLRPLPGGGRLPVTGRQSKVAFSSIIARQASAASPPLFFSDPGAGPGLLVILDGQDAVAQRHPMPAREIHQAARALAADIIVMRGLAADDAAERDEAVEGAPARSSAAPRSPGRWRPESRRRRAPRGDRRWRPPPPARGRRPPAARRRSRRRTAPRRSADGAWRRRCSHSMSLMGDRPLALDAEAVAVEADDRLAVLESRIMSRTPRSSRICAPMP